MLVVRLDSVLEDIIRYETETSGLEAAKPVIKRLDSLERRIDTELFHVPDDDESRQIENRRKISNTILNVCLQTVQTVPRPSEADIIKKCKVNALLSIRSDDPFEKFIQQAIDHTMRERTQPILEILDMLEMKVDEYGRNAVMTGIAGPIPKTLTWNGSDTDIKTSDEITKKNENKSLVKSDLKFDVREHFSIPKKMIVRVTCWRYHTKEHPDPSKIYLDLTKKRVDLLIENTGNKD